MHERVNPACGHSLDGDPGPTRRSAPAQSRRRQRHQHGAAWRAPGLLTPLTTHEVGGSSPGASGSSMREREAGAVPWASGREALLRGVEDRATGNAGVPLSKT